MEHWPPAVPIELHADRILQTQIAQTAAQKSIWNDKEKKECKDLLEECNNKLRLFTFPFEINLYRQAPAFTPTGYLDHMTKIDEKICEEVQRQMVNAGYYVEIKTIYDPQGRINRDRFVMTVYFTKPNVCVLL